MFDFSFTHNVETLPGAASSEDIRKAYRKAALRWHPDKNPDDKEHASAMFKSVADAYDVLSNPEKRSLYDRSGKDMSNGEFGFGCQTGSSSMNEAFDIFQQFFGGQDPFADMFEDMQFGRGPGGHRGMASMFNNDFFGGGFGGGSDMSFSSFSSSSMGGGSGGDVVSSSTMTSTKIVNGQRVTVTEKTVLKADGTVETTRSESTGEGREGGSTALQDDSFGGF